jgi:hypothetical protein
MSMVRCCGCNKPMDTDEPGSIYGDIYGLYCLGCFDDLEEDGPMDLEDQLDKALDKAFPASREGKQ